MPKRNPKLFLLHPTRWQIYKMIAEVPGTYFYKLLKELPKYSEKVSSATILYHLKKLGEEGLLNTAKVDGKRIYFPNNLRNGEIERVFMLLKNENAKKIFQYIVNNKNPFQNQIARELNVHHDTIYHHTKRLIEAGLIEKEKQGKFTCFSLGTVGKDLLAGSLNIMTEEYIQFILEKLSDWCHFPEIISKTENTVVIRIVCPKSDDIEISISLGSFELV
jgi:predicted transcriptional regulator